MAASGPMMTLAVLVLCLTIPIVADQEAAPPSAPSPPNPVVFWELATNDGPRSVEFFKTVFDWTSAPVPGAKTFFHTLDSGAKHGGIDGGVFTLVEAKLPFLTVYILVDDIMAKAELVKQAGGLVVIPPHEIQPGTWICLFNEPSGVTFAMLEKRAPK